MRNKMRLLASLMATAALMAVHAQPADAQALDMSGTWAFEVESDNGITHPSLVLVQDGTNLTGHYSSETLGEADVTGTISGRNVTVDFSAMLEGLGQAPLSYTGSVSAEGVWSGELAADLQGQVFPIGTFTATKQ